MNFFNLSFSFGSTRLYTVAEKYAEWSYTNIISQNLNFLLLRVKLPFAELVTQFSSYTAKIVRKNAEWEHAKTYSQILRPKVEFLNYLL